MNATNNNSNKNPWKAHVQINHCLLLCLSKQQQQTPPPHPINQSCFSTITFLYLLHTQNVIYNSVFIWIGDRGHGRELNSYQQIHLNLAPFPGNSILTDLSEVKWKCQYTYKGPRKKKRNQMTAESQSFTMLAIMYLFENLQELFKIRFCFVPCCHQFLS